jgi:hypothetical protein
MKMTLRTECPCCGVEVEMVVSTEWGDVPESLPGVEFEEFTQEEVDRLNKIVREEDRKEAS